jgi:hypothetical protein
MAWPGWRGRAGDLAVAGAGGRVGVFRCWAQRRGLGRAAQKDVGGMFGRSPEGRGFVLRCSNGGLAWMGLFSSLWALCCGSARLDL